MNSSFTWICCIFCVILSFTANTQLLGEKLLLEYCKINSIVMSFSEGQTKFGDFTFARVEEYLDSHLKTVTETARGGKCCFIYVPKNGKLHWGWEEQGFTSLVSKLRQMVLKWLHQQRGFVFCRDPYHRLNPKTKQTVGVLLLSCLCWLLAVTGNKEGESKVGTWSWKRIVGDHHFGL